MDVPEAFRDDREVVLCEAMAAIRLAALVTPGPEGIAVTHAPVVVRRDAGRLSIEAHVARGNPHWRVAGSGAPDVAIFQGPHAQVSPSRYPSKAEHGKVVPTWASIAVHAHGMLEAMSDEAWLRHHLDGLTDAGEAGRARLWQVSDAPESCIGVLSRGIFGFRLMVHRLEGRRKINQHKPPPHRDGTAEGLAAGGESGRALVAALLAAPARP